MINEKYKIFKFLILSLIFGLLFGFLASAFGSVVAFSQLPPSLGFVTDYGYMIQPAEKEAIESLCAVSKQKFGIDLAVVTVKMTAPLTPKDYVFKLYKNWGIGQKTNQKGILILVAKDEQRVEVEVGVGLKNKLSAGKVGEILDQYLVPAFLDGKYGQGVVNTVSAMTGVINLVPQSKPKVNPQPKQEPKKDPKPEPKPGLKPKAKTKFKALEAGVVLASIIILWLLYSLLEKTFLGRFIVLFGLGLIGFVLVGWVGAIIGAILAFLFTGRGVKGGFRGGDFQGGFSGYRGFKNKGGKR